MSFYVDRIQNIPLAFFEIAQRSPEAEVYQQVGYADQAPEEKSPIPRQRTSRTYREVERRVLSLALELLPQMKLDATGTRPRVAIIANTRCEWMEADLGILACGGITVAIYHSLSDEEVAYILFDSGAKLVFAENQEQVDKLLRISKRRWAIPATEDRAATEAEIHIEKIYTFENVAVASDPNEQGHPPVCFCEEIFARDIGDTSKAMQELPFRTIQSQELATLVYTSGTTGPPKGVMQTHLNHLSNVRQVYQAGIVRENTSLFLFLPLAHSFARLMGMIGFLTPVTIYFPAVFSRDHSRLEPRSVLRDMKEVGANVVPIVPRFLEKMEEAIRSRAKRSSISGRLLRMTLSVAESNYALRVSGQTPTTAQQLLFRTTSPVRRSIRESLFGTGFQFAVSGGAKLPVHIARFFLALEIPVLEGYGLTETCVATNFNALGKNKPGTVGPVLAPDIEQRLDAEDEICFRGPNVSLGYWQRPTATAASWDAQGWFHTGDLGTIDEEGYLSIVGRKKDIIVTSGGKKVSPQNIEEQLKAHPQVSQVVLVGDGRPYCVALFTTTTRLDETNKAHIEKEIREHVEACNRHLASFETIKNIMLLPEDFTIENGLLTPTMKVKRKQVEFRFARELDQLYKSTKRASE